MEQEGLGADDEIRNEPNETETEPLLAFAPERPAAYEKFRVGRKRQQPKRWIIPAQFALKVSFWSLGMWGHRAWKSVAHTLLVIVFVFLIITWAYSCDPLQLCSIYCNHTTGTGTKKGWCCYHYKFGYVVNFTLVTASFLSCLVFTACYRVGKRNMSALACPPQFLIKETDKVVIFVLFLAFLVMNSLLASWMSSLLIVNIDGKPKCDEKMNASSDTFTYAFTVTRDVTVVFLFWVSLNVCHSFAAICTVMGRL